MSNRLMLYVHRTEYSVRIRIVNNRLHKQSKSLSITTTPILLIRILVQNPASRMNDLQDADDDLVPTLTSQEISADLDEEIQDFRFLSHLSQ